MQIQFCLILVLSALAVSIAEQREKSVNGVRQRLTSSLPQQNPLLIDSLRRRYLALEHDLWNLMDSGIDTAYVLEQIHLVHLRLFHDHFNEFNVTFYDYAVDRQTQLLDIVSNINRTVSLIEHYSLRQNPLSFDEDQTINAARYQLNLTDQINTLYEITEPRNFYETIKNVSDFNSILLVSPSIV